MFPPGLITSSSGGGVVGQSAVMLGTGTYRSRFRQIASVEGAKSWGEGGTDPQLAGALQLSLRPSGGGKVVGWHLVTTPDPVGGRGP